jgi:hypothetical protein
MHYIILPVFSAYKRPDDGSSLQPKHVAVNKLINTDIVCDWFNALG